MLQGEWGSLMLRIITQESCHLPSPKAKGRSLRQWGGGRREHRKVAMTVGSKSALPLIGRGALLSPSLSASPAGKHTRPHSSILRSRRCKAEAEGSGEFRGKWGLGIGECLKQTSSISQPSYFGRLTVQLLPF